MIADIDCSRCGRRLERTSRAAGISILQQGDERVDSWYWCVGCGVWTVKEYLDVFIGEERVSIRGPLAVEVGEKAVAIIRKCKNPFDKWCECEAHKEYESS